jgi:hypothetical protein
MTADYVFSAKHRLFPRIFRASSSSIPFSSSSSPYFYFVILVLHISIFTHSLFPPHPLHIIIIFIIIIVHSPLLRQLPLGISETSLCFMLVHPSKSAPPPDVP